MIGSKSLVQLAIECCKQSRLTSRILLSTDSPEIAAESESHGLPVPFLRPNHLATDTATDGELFTHLISELETRESYVPDILVNVRPTAPFRNAADVDSAITLLMDNPHLRSVKSVCVSSAHPRKMWSIQNGELRSLVPQLEELFPDPDTPRQLLPEYYQSNGAVDACWVRHLREFGRMHTTHIGVVIMPRERSLDIDGQSDLESARRALGY
jgi:CMP-N-acetylneuraminic acid synthetase